ncbi:MAG: PLD nuclease N-terminal domain-containing protein [Caldilinea sp.]|nr:PLDc_N domain-containing protein [Caldilinea sp.]MCB0059304.1 PLDc_N domain-containing protein [Caldilineaceae bacterium]MCB0040252.1 PLDc_N domain-containing protein [Caldilinea sp.]MCB0051778.1 PLDc_N domain-containing protein [Caldilinea sp.]MCB0138030.1 PLDc_N domain-containing protein [Caldilineaceae bacterium]
MGQKKKWNEFSPAQKAGSIVAGIVQVTLLVAALVDIRRRPAEEIRGRKGLWAVFAFVNWIGPISYFLFGRKQAAGEITSESAA